jgi:hypothetical protein
MKSSTASTSNASPTAAWKKKPSSSADERGRMLVSVKRTTIFLSYAREDLVFAERLYKDLRLAELDVWMDSKCLLPGQRWKQEVDRIIRNSAYFVALISQNSLNKRGHVQREIKHALEILSEVPTTQIYFVPARIDKAVPTDPELVQLNWVDLHPDYETGLSRLMALFSPLEKDPLVMFHPSRPMGSRAPIQYTPFRDFTDIIRDVLSRLPESSAFIDLTHPIFLNFVTTHPEVVMAEYLRTQYPETMGVVLHYQFKDFSVDSNKFYVTMWFDGKEEKLAIPFSAVNRLAFPAIHLLVQRLPD